MKVTFEFYGPLIVRKAAAACNRIWAQAVTVDKGGFAAGLSELSYDAGGFGGGCG